VKDVIIPDHLQRAKRLADQQSDDLSRFIAIMAEMGRSSPGDPENIHHFLLRRARRFEWRALPADVAKQPDKECYSNALDLATLRDLTYCEGFAHNSLIPVLHAWCVTDEGVVIDPTWQEHEDRTPEYLGLTFDTTKVITHLLRQKYHGVLANWRRPLEELELLLNDR
jgi:hypothetical protein